MVIWKTNLLQISYYFVYFIRRCFCTYHPVAKDFIIRQEINLFLHRLETLSLNDWRKSCKAILKQIPQLQNYKVFNSITRCVEKPLFGELLWSTLSNICETLLNHAISRHLKTDCDVNCNKYCTKGMVTVFETVFTQCFLGDLWAEPMIPFWFFESANITLTLFASFKYCMTVFMCNLVPFKFFRDLIERIFWLLLFVQILIFNSQFWYYWYTPFAFCHIILSL